MGLFDRFKKQDYAQDFLDAYQNKDTDKCKIIMHEWGNDKSFKHDTNKVFAWVLVNYLIYGKDTSRRLKYNFDMTIDEWYHKFLLSPEFKPKNKKLAPKYEAEMGTLALMEKNGCL